MSWVLTNLVDAVLLPPLNLILVQAVGLLLWKRKPRVARGLIIAGMSALLLLCTPAVATRLLSGLETRFGALNLHDPGLSDRAEAIVVLGAGRSLDAPEYGADTVQSGGLERLRYAAHLYARTKKPVLISGGLPDRPGASEAKLMQEVLTRDLSTPVEWIEEESTNTRQNALKSFEFLRSKGIHRVFLVTHASHMPRAERSFRVAGLEIVPAPMGFESSRLHSSLVDWVPNAKALEMSYTVFHECIGLIWYELNFLLRRGSSP